jgi:hypothetical protein
MGNRLLKPIDHDALSHNAPQCVAWKLILLPLPGRILERWRGTVGMCPRFVLTARIDGQESHLIRGATRRSRSR